MSLSLSKHVEGWKTRLLSSEELSKSLPFLSFTFIACCYSEQGIEMCLNKNAIFLISGRNYIIICKIFALNSIGSLPLKGREPGSCSYTNRKSHKPWISMKTWNFPSTLLSKNTYPFPQKEVTKILSFAPSQKLSFHDFSKVCDFNETFKKVINIKNYSSNYKNLPYSFRINFVEHFSCDLFHYLFI